MKKIIYNQHTAIRKIPVNLKKEDLTLFDHELNKTIQQTVLYSLQNAYILRDAIFEFRNLKFYFSSTHMSEVSTLSKIRRLVMLFNKGENIDKGIWIIDNWSTGYFHWLTDALPRLVASLDYIDDHVLILPVYYKKVSFITDSLDFFECKVIYYNTRSKIHVNKLLLPSHTAFTGNYNNVLINRLREIFLKGISIPAFKRIYISRLKASKRKVINEIEVVEVLKQFDFEIHYFEDYNFKKQIELMAETKYLIGLHGAGLTNMIFMQRNSHILELRNKNDNHNNCYFSLASELDIHYYYQQNQGNSKNTNITNVLVDINELTHNLQLMISK